MVPFVLAGCYEISMDFNVNDDGSGTYELGLEVDLDAVAALLAEEGDDIDPTSICDDMLSDAGGDELAGGSAEYRLKTMAQFVARSPGSWDAGAAELVEDSAEDLTLPKSATVGASVQLGESYILTSVMTKRWTRQCSP